ncbi:restriction endonuclease subunit S [Xanthomonas sp. PPL139]|uniref:restriction endonuclease subunit S n=1 Tax=unclassified Xanthomonas TaxID=2643310 RepID=UPI0033A51EF6
MKSESWNTESVADCIVPVSVAGKSKIQSRDYKQSGRFPVIDQGQQRIAGWTDDEGAIIETPLPLVVFGDHTRAFKFLDEPFARGADGTQLLRPKPGIDPLFFFYACRAIDLPARGYNRHFAVLKEKVLSYPFDEDEQKAIAAVLRQTESALVQQSAQLGVLQELKRAAMSRLFTRGLRDEAQKETGFGSIPEAWTVIPLNECATVQTGAAKGRKLPEDEAVDVPYLRVANVQDGRLDLREMKTIRIRQSEIQRYRLLPGDVVLTEGGDFDKLGRGFIWRGELDFCVHQNHVFAVRPDRGQLLPEFFAYLAQSAYGKAYFLKVAHKTTNLACINSTKLKEFPVPIPPTLDEQSEIVAILDALDRKVALHREKRAVLEELFQSLLHKLMTGEIRVADLDLSALLGAPAQLAEATA